MCFTRFLRKLRFLKSALKALGAILVKPKIRSIWEKTWFFSEFLNTLLKVNSSKRCRKVISKISMWFWALESLQETNLTSTINELWKSRVLFFVISVQVCLLFLVKVFKMTFTNPSKINWLSKTTFKKSRNIKETYNYHDMLKIMKSWTFLWCFAQLPVKWATSGQNGVQIRKAQTVGSKWSLLRNQTLVFTKTAFRASKQHRVSISGVQVSLPVEGG